MDQSYQTIKRVYLEARALAPEERGAFLDRTCAGEAGLRAEVENLLGHEETLGEFLARPASAALAREPAAEPTSHPERIGAYRVLKPLGWGGMGVVYLAEQDSPRRAVALKLLRLDAASPAQVARFEREAELLGRLGHPGIARVYEAGWAETETGRRPYFAMELVEGRALHEYVSEKKLDLAAKLRLVCQVAEAAHYAHERGVVHRDLKPSNVLIEERGEPKVLDFGVARQLGADSSATQTGQLVGTLSYMSPEQASGHGQVDARSDVYSLGVILYELLTGRLPIVTEGLPLHEAVRRVREEEPIAAGSVRRELAGDLETILGKALAKEPARRYATAAEFAEDLRLFLDHRPIRARLPTSLYVAWKLVRRHRALSGAVVALTLVLLGSQYWSLKWFALKREKQLLEQYNRSNEAQKDFYLELVVHHQILDSIQSVEREGKLLTRPDINWTPDVLEAWLARVERLAEHLPRHRRDLEQAQAWAALPEREGALFQPAEMEYAVKLQSDIVNQLEELVGPRGDVPLVRARLEQLRNGRVAEQGPAEERR